VFFISFVIYRVQHRYCIAQHGSKLKTNKCKESMKYP
jgi:hypothetical protein